MSPSKAETPAGSDATLPRLAHVRADGRTQGLAQHLFGVADLAASFASKIGLANHGEVLGLLHDMGKYSDAFQAYLQSATGLLDPDADAEYVDAAGLKGKIDHSTAGAQLAWETCREHGSLGVITGQILALCLASHHSGMIDCLTADEQGCGDDVFTRRIGKPDDRTFRTEALAKADPAVLERIRFLLAQESLYESVRQRIGMITQASRRKTRLAIDVHQQIGLLARLLFSCLVDADRTDSARFERREMPAVRSDPDDGRWDVLLNRFEEFLERMRASDSAEQPINAIRRQVSDHCAVGASRERGIFTLTVPTGGGKTLSSLRFALRHAREHRMDRVVFVIPFTSIIDQNADVARRVLEPAGTVPGSVVLEHHSNLAPAVQSWRNKLLVDTWDAPVIFTTAVQVLETLFGEGTRGVRRLHQLANSVIVFDEIQSLPVNCIHLFNNAVNFLAEQCGATVVICTATQPLLHQVDARKGALRLAPDAELMPDVHALFTDLRRVEIQDSRRAGGWASAEIAALVVAECERTGNCLVIVNTKAAAHSVYGDCGRLTAARLFHLSTSMCPAHRRACFAEMRALLDHESPVICVSTQLIEAGVDIDFRSVVRCAAGLDSIAQAAGRCNRHGRHALAQVHVVNPQDEPLRYLRDIRVGRECAERVLDDFRSNPGRFRGDLLGPDAMRWYYENYFFARARDMDYRVGADVLGHDDSLLELLSVNSQASAEYVRATGSQPDIYLRQSFMAAARAFRSIDAPTRGIVVPWGDDGRELLAEMSAADSPVEQARLLWRAQQYTVNVWPKELDQLGREGAVAEILPETGVLCLADARYYTNTVGLGTSPEGRQEFLNG